MWQVKSVAPWAHKFAMRSLLLAGSTALILALAASPASGAQVTIAVGVTPPICSFGYYNYAPYGCAPSGFYGPGYFHNGIFLGVGPWANWGYGHGWGEYRFREAGGGTFIAARGEAGYSERGVENHAGYSQSAQDQAGANHAGDSQAAQDRAAANHAGDSQGAQARAAANHAGDSQGAKNRAAANHAGKSQAAQQRAAANHAGKSQGAQKRAAANHAGDAKKEKN